MLLSRLSVRTRLRYFSRFVPILLGLAIMLSHGSASQVSASTPASPLTDQPSRLYAATGFSVGSAFLSFFDKYGGVGIFGYPISPEVTESGMTVQYFERQRFEHHKEFAGTQHEVQLGALGVDTARGKVSLAPVAVSANTANHLYLHKTGHSLSGAFLNFWRANGNIRVLGYPISEPVTINGLLTQYFERARMEYHPEKASSGYAVELGHLGKEYLVAHPGLAAAGTIPPPPVTSPASTMSAGSQQLFELINGARQAAGVKPVVVDNRIGAVSQGRSFDMASRIYFSHITPEGKSFEDFLKGAGISYKFGGEILSQNNFRADLAPGKAYEFFMNSPAHKAIMLDARFASVGVGEAKDNKGFYVYTVIFVQTP